MILINFKSKIDIMNLAYIAKLNIQVQKTEVGDQKINVFFLKTYTIVIVVFQILDKLSRLQLF